MRWLSILFLLAGLTPAMADKTICRPTFDGFMEFECQTVEKGKLTAAGFCEVLNRQGGAVLWSSRDTEETKNRADLINAAGKRLCGWGRK